MNISTINVIHTTDKYDIKCYSFLNENTGIIQAEKKFVEICKSITNENVDSDFIEAILDDGIYEYNENIIVINYSE